MSTFQGKATISMSTVTGWFPWIITTLFGGAVGSLVTTYGSKTGERRSARSRVRTELYRTSSRVFRQDEDQLSESLNDFEIAAMHAGLPEAWVQLYASVSSTLRLSLELQSARPQESQEFRKIMQFVARELMIVIDAATWHPWRTRLLRWHSVRRYKQLYGSIHLSLLLKGLAAVKGWDTPEQLTDYFDFPVVDRKEQRSLIRFSRSKDPEHFIYRPPNIQDVATARSPLTR